MVASPPRADVDLLALHEHFPDRYPALLESVSGADALGCTDLLFALPGEKLVQRADGTLEGDAPHAPGMRFLDALDAWGGWGHSGISTRRGHSAISSRKTGRIAAEDGAERDAAGVSHGELANSRVSPNAGNARVSPYWLLYLGYELAQEIEPTLRLPGSRLPRAVAWRMQGAVLRDRRTGRLAIRAGSGRLEDALRAQLEADLDAIAARRPPPAQTGPLATDLREQDPLAFNAGVRAVLEAIARGDVYQANLSRPWTARLAPGATAVDLYRALRRANPAPFAAIADLGDLAVLSSSPERLLELRDGYASTRPIAGTRPRGSTPGADAALVRELRLSEKEQAEHVMLVDLGRNDLGRICAGGTVHVDEYMTIETYATVHHIVSNVRGRLREGVTPGEAIAAVFPGGTITGCPKVRCMQLLADLEREPRDAYTGSLGYLGTDGSLDLNILIRTLTVHDGAIGFRTGAGIVADSGAEAELAETRAKAHGILRALGDGS